MKIAIIADVLFPFSIGGSEIRNHEIAKRLVENGHNVHMFGMKYWEGPDIFVYEGVALHGICSNRKIYNSRGKRKAMSAIFLSFRLFKVLMKENFDILDVASFIFTNCYVTKIITLIKREKLVFTWHQYLGTYLFGYFGKINGLAAFLLEYFSIKLANKNIVVSQHVQEELLKRGIQKNNTILIESGSDIGLIHSIPMKEKIYDLIFVGRLTYQKNLTLLINAVALAKKDYPNIKVCVIGDGDQYIDLCTQIKNKGLIKNFDFKGRENHRKKIFLLMKQSKIFILTSLLEGLPLTEIEANACGIPILTTKTKWNDIEFFLKKNGESGVAVSADAALIAKNIVNLLGDKKRLDVLGKNGLRKTEEYDWDNIAQKTEKFYMKTLGEYFTA